MDSVAFSADGVSRNRSWYGDGGGVDGGGCAVAAADEDDYGFLRRFLCCSPVTESSGEKKMPKTTGTRCLFLDMKTVNIKIVQ